MSDLAVFVLTSEEKSLQNSSVNNAVELTLCNSEYLYLLTMNWHVINWHRLSA